LPRTQDTLQLEPEAMARRPDAEAPLLGKPDAASPPATPPPPPKRNKYPFFCAVLASMTSVLMGYSTHRRLD